MARAAVLLGAVLSIGCSPCPSGTHGAEEPVAGGEVERVCRTDDGLLHGPYKRLRDGRPVLEGTWEQGQRTGTWTAFHSGGTRAARRQYLDDRRVGLWQEWSEDGTLRSEVHWANGVRHGQERAWHPDGTLAVRGGYVEGRRDGVWTAWHDNGRRRWEHNFELGLRDGAWTEWSAEGQVVVQGTYEAGRREGRWEERYPDGRAKLLVQYDAGSIVSIDRWDEKGSPKAPVVRGQTAPADVSALRMPPSRQPPDPRVAWAVALPGEDPATAAVEVRNVVVVGRGRTVWGIRVDDPNVGWSLELPERVAAVAPVAEGEEALLWTRAGSLVSVGPTRVPDTWTLHRLDADLAVAPAVAWPHALYVGRDNRLHLYDRVAEETRWSRALKGEALLVGLAPERAWVLTTAGLLSVHDLPTGEVVETTAFLVDGAPRWTSRPMHDFLLLWWRGDVLEAVRPLDGEVAWTWEAPTDLDPEEARVARVAAPRGDLGVFAGHRAWILDSTATGRLEATPEALEEPAPAEFASCTSWGQVCVRADRDGSIAYPGGRPWLGTGLAAAPSLGEDRLWVVSDRGWLARVDFEPRVDLEVERLAWNTPGADGFRLASEWLAGAPPRRVTWRDPDGGWEQVGVHLPDDFPGGARLEAEVTLSLQGGVPTWAQGWTELAREDRQEVHYRYRVYRELRDLELEGEAPARLADVLACRDRDPLEVRGSVELVGATRIDGEPLFRRRVEGSFELAATTFAKACAVMVTHRGSGELGAFGPPGRPVATAQPLRVELHGTTTAHPAGSLEAAEPPRDLEGVDELVVVRPSGFGPEQRLRVAAPERVTVAGPRWVIRSAAGDVVLDVPEISLDPDVHAEAPHSVSVVTWRLRSDPWEAGPHPVRALYRRTASSGLRAAAD